MTQPNDRLELRAGKIGKDKQRVVTATPPGGDATIIGRFDLADDEARSRLTEKICERFNGLEPGDVEACVEKLAVQTEAPSDQQDSEEAESSQADGLVVLANEMFEVFPGDDGEVYAVRRGGSGTALSMSGGHDSMRECLASEFYERRKRVPRSASISDAMLVIGGIAKRQPRRPVHLRTAAVNGGYEIDLGDETGRCIVVSAQGWAIQPRATVHFYRTAITLPMAEPERGSDLDELWKVMNVSEHDRPLVLTYALVALMPDRESPVLMANGPKGSGKSSIARAIMETCDPTVGGTRTPPTNPDQWSVSAAGSRIVAIDNVSGISQWLSDAFCRATTGDAYVTRAFYTNKSLSAVRFRIALMITAIDAGAIRDDFGDRCVVVEAPVISRSQRVADHEMKRRLASARGRLLGSLLDLLVRVLAELPNVVLDELPRIGDFYTVLAAVDRVLGTNGLAAFDDQAQRVVEDVIESDPTSMALLAFMQGKGSWNGSATELLGALWNGSPPKGAPRDGRALASALRRMQPTLLLAGLVVEPPEPNARPREWRINWGSRSEGGGASSDRRTVGETPSAAPPSGFSGPRRFTDDIVGNDGPIVGEPTTPGELRRSDDTDDANRGQNDTPPDDEWEVFR